MTATELLRIAGAALYGPRWQSALAHDLGVSDRTVRHWLSGRMLPRSPVWNEIHSLLRQRAGAVAAAQRILAEERRADLPEGAIEDTADAASRPL